jgi:hypothetical protein
MTELFIEKCKLINGNKYDYSKVDYKNANTKIIKTNISILNVQMCKFMFHMMFMKLEVIRQYTNHIILYHLHQNLLF